MKLLRRTAKPTARRVRCVTGWWRRLATPSTLNFVPDNHIVVVQATQVVRHFEDVWSLWRATGRPLPRTLNIISGPSRTADIEQTVTLGAHGPDRVLIIIVG